ncbi:origin recognition complex subunit 5 [Anopheles ziemanni]|uniref:origin recognition complex subunit 5 n=1 Tax=Anopheles coustani TaxID=139045 RepID=UPI0026580F7B|nr:origin recognition complex subunit 5 [Anopheles coustani]XP_058174874.1 origin recognition complex subunit 5 [Anopheles ziemanni]
MEQSFREKIVEEISLQFPCRETIIRKLYQYYGTGDPFPPAIYMYGHTSTGKSSVLESLFSRLDGIRYVVLNTIGAYTNKIFFETIAQELQDHLLSSANNYSYSRKLEYMKDFLAELRKLEPAFSYVIVLENAERLRDMDHNVLPMMLQLPEATGLNISVVLVSSLPFEKYYTRTGLPPLIKLFVPEYTRDDIQRILMNDYEKIKLDACDRTNFCDLSPSEQAKRSSLVEKTLTKEFYANYVNIFLSTFWKVCRDVKELQLVANECFVKYYEPVLEGTIDAQDAMKLWRNISKVMRSALSTIYMRMGMVSQQDVPVRLAQNIELPYYAKYLLIAAYLASHNAAKEDKRLFMKNHGKQKKRLQTVNARAKVVEKMATQLGPKPFSVDRLLAIFYAIIDEKVGLTCNLLAQIPTLMHLKFLTCSTGESSTLEGSSRLQCNVGLDFIVQIGRMVGFNVRQYLSDFV